MPFSRKFVLTRIAVLLVLHSLAQQALPQKQADTFEKHLTSSLVACYKKYPQEKVFVHTNQSVYSSGETIWYKVYAMAYGKPSALSGVVYVQLTDTAGNVLIQNKIPLTNGRAHGNMGIDQKLNSGWYRLNAFTSWMLNFDRAAWYRQKIYIHNPKDAGAAAPEDEVHKKDYHINFYPEGGDLVAGNLTRVAFKAVDDDGLPAGVEGLVKDKSGATIDKLITEHDGMGMCNFEPEAGNAYSATVTFPDGSGQEIKLPEVKTSGVGLKAGQGASTVQLKIAISGMEAKSENCLLAAFQNNGQLKTYPLQLFKGINDFELSKDGFSTGILRLTLFDDRGVPCAERILFINKHDLQIPLLKADTLSFAAHGVNAFSMAVKDMDNHPLNGNFSVAVTDAAAFADPAEQNIFSALLLSPELKGEIYKPGFYFKDESDSLAHYLDLVMMTNGWRHFVWRDILNNEPYTLKYPVEHGQDIAGKILDYKNLVAATPNMQLKLMVINQDSSRFVGYILPDSTGSFVLKDFNHKGLSDIYIQVTDKKGKPQKFQFKLFNTVADSLANSKQDGFNGGPPPLAGDYYAAILRNRENELIQANTTLLNTVNIKGRKESATEKIINDHVTETYLSAQAFTLDLANSPTNGNMSLIDYIQGKFPGLQIIAVPGDPNVHFEYRGSMRLVPDPTLPTGNSASMQTQLVPDKNIPQPYFYINETLVPFADVKDISLDDVALIRFLPPPVPSAPFNGGSFGAIMVYTKTNRDEVKRITGNGLFDHYIFNGYSVTREFGQPEYNRIKQDGPPDNRTTLYWNHDIETDNNGILKFRFYNSAIAKKFRVIIQGMDNDGRLVYVDKTIQ